MLSVSLKSDHSRPAFLTASEISGMYCSCNDAALHAQMTSHSEFGKAAFQQMEYKVPVGGNQTLSDALLQQHHRPEQDTLLQRHDADLLRRALAFNVQRAVHDTGQCHSSDCRACSA